MKTLPTVLGAALLSITVVAWSSTPPRNDYVVRIDKLFSPDNLDINVGDRVTWKSFDADNHTVTGQFSPAVPRQEDDFDSGIIPSGGSYDHLFTREGVCHYWCRIHPDIRGTITVRR